jgi:hypothetical protein
MSKIYEINQKKCIRYMTAIIPCRDVINIQFTSGRHNYTRKAPSYMIIPLMVAQRASETSQNAQKAPVIGFLLVRAVTLIEF